MTTQTTPVTEIVNPETGAGVATGALPHNKLVVNDFDSLTKAVYSVIEGHRVDLVGAVLYSVMKRVEYDVAFSSANTWLSKDNKK